MTDLQTRKAPRPRAADIAAAAGASADEMNATIQAASILIATLAIISGTPAASLERLLTEFDANTRALINGHQGRTTKGNPQ